MQALTATIQLKDQRGNVIGEKEVATYAGLLAQAHQEGLREISTSLVQIPTSENGFVAIVTATVVTDKGTFTGIGDANPENVGRKIVPHIIRMAETRAKARALRDAVNIGVVALEELGGEDGEDTNFAPAPAPAPAPRPSPGRPPLRPVPPPREAPRHPPPDARRDSRGSGRDGGGGTPMTEPQRKLLYRLLFEQGFEGQAATDALLRAAGVNDLRRITKGQASQLIEHWKNDESRSAAR